MVGSLLVFFKEPDNRDIKKSTPSGSKLSSLGFREIHPREQLIPMRYIDDDGAATETCPGELEDRGPLNDSWP